MNGGPSMREIKILVVEDDPEMGDTCVKLFRHHGMTPVLVSSGRAALEAIQRDSSIRIVLTDLKMPEMDGVELLQKIKEFDAEIEVIIMTGYGTIQNAVQALKLGAADYITKPFDSVELLRSVEKIMNLLNLQREVSDLRRELASKYGYGNIIGQSKQMRQVFERARAAAQVDSPVLIYGESGTGKELVARAIHYNGHRSKGPFVPVNCGALPEELIESELFGYKKGAFTGAVRDSIGLFRAADGGTLFLDEITEIPQATQVKLLRALQDKKIRPVGGTEEIYVDLRIIAASNKNLNQALSDGSLREDLYYRLGVIVIELPPLRERQEDIPFLVQHFIDKFNRQFRRNVKKIDKEALDALMAYRWPGNVRELENVMEGIFVLRAPSETITRLDLPPNIRGSVSKAYPANREEVERDLPLCPLSDMEREAIARALRACHGNKSKAAEMLGISRTRLYKKMRVYKLRA